MLVGIRNVRLASLRFCRIGKLLTFGDCDDGPDLRLRSCAADDVTEEVALSSEVEDAMCCWVCMG